MASHKLCACIGYSIRLASKQGLGEVTPHLWQALSSVLRPAEIRHTISLNSALGFDTVDVEHCATQTDVEVIEKSDCERIMGTLAREIAKYKDVMDQLTGRLSTLERQSVAMAAPSTPVLHETQHDLSRHCQATVHQECAGRDMLASSSATVGHGTAPARKLERTLADIKALMEDHKQQRLALHMQRRRERE